MNDFTNFLIDKNFYVTNNTTKNSFRHNNLLKFCRGKITLSIQAGYRYHSIPNTTGNIKEAFIKFIMEEIC